MRDYKIPFWWVEKVPKRTSIFEHVVIFSVAMAISVGLFLVVL